MDGDVLRQLGPKGLQLGFLLIAREADVAVLSRRDALFQSDIVERVAVPEDVLKLMLLRGRRPQLLLVGLAARWFCRLFAHACVFPSRGTKVVAHQDCWLQPRQARL